MGVPTKIADAIKELVYKKADKHRYLNRARNENNNFLTTLVEEEGVGGRLSAFMARDKVRSYIKDAILNRYSKDVAQRSRPDDFSVPIREQTGVDGAVFVEKDESKNIFLYKSPKGDHYFIVADGAYMKWETALRKGLVYIASDKPFLRKSGVQIHLLLSLFARKQSVPPTDAKLLRRALKRCGCSVFIYGEK